MSTILPGPALGKRKSIDSCPYDHDSSAKEKTILGEKKDAAVCEKDKEAKEEAILVDKDEPILGEEEEEITLDNDGLRKLIADLSEKLIQEMKASGKTFDDVSFDDLKCRICLQTGHYNCPWDRGSSAATLPKVGPGFRLLCARCGKVEFGKKDPGGVMTCEACGCDIIRAIRKICPFAACTLIT